MKIEIDLIGWDNGVESHGETAKVLESHGFAEAKPVCSTVRSIERKVAREALRGAIRRARPSALAAFDMLGDTDNAGIFRDQYGIVLRGRLPPRACDRTRQVDSTALKDDPGQIILEVEQWEVCAPRVRRDDKPGACDSTR